VGAVAVVGAGNTGPEVVVSGGTGLAVIVVVSGDTGPELVVIGATGLAVAVVGAGDTGPEVVVSGGTGLAVAVVGAGDTGPEVVVARVSSVLHPPPVSIRNELLRSISSSLHCRDPLSTASFIALVINASFSSIPAVPVFTYKIDEA
jgi:hypothetical protein